MTGYEIKQKMTLIASFQTTVASEYNKLASIDQKHDHEMGVYEHATLMFGKE